jgi:hypothetical protein
MPQQRLYYDYAEGELIPFWYVLTFKPCEFDWEKHVYYFTFIAPFEFVERHEFDESLINVSIQHSDFIINPDHPNRIGININSVKKRIEKHGIDPYVVSQFIMSTPDLNEFISLLPRQRKMSLMVS